MELDDPGLLQGVSLGFMGSNSGSKRGTDQKVMSEKNMWAQMVQSKHFKKSFKGSGAIQDDLLS